MLSWKSFTSKSKVQNSSAIATDKLFLPFLPCTSIEDHLARQRYATKSSSSAGTLNSRPLVGPSTDWFFCMKRDAIIVVWLHLTAFVRDAHNERAARQHLSFGRFTYEHRYCSILSRLARNCRACVHYGTITSANRNRNVLQKRR